MDRTRASSPPQASSHWPSAPAAARPHRAGSSPPPRPARHSPPRAPQPPRPSSRRRTPSAIEAFDLGFTPAAVQVKAAGTYPVTFANTGSTLHDVTFADGTTLTAEAGKTATGSVTVPAEGLAFICSIPGHADAGMKGQVTVGGDMGMAMPAASAAAARRPAPRRPPVADPNAPAYDAASTRRRRRVLAGHGPRHRPADHREGHHGRRGLRRPRLDVRRDGARADDPGPPRRHRQRASDQPGPDEPLHRLPRQPDRDEPPDGGDQARRDVHLHVHGRLRRRVDVPLRHRAGAPPHRERHVRDGDRRAQGRPAQGRRGVRLRPERVVPRRAGRARELREGEPDRRRRPTSWSSTASRTSTRTTPSR